MTQSQPIDESALYDEVDFKDFTVARKYIGFKIGEDKFIATARLGIPTIQALVKAAGQIEKIREENRDEALQALFVVFDEVLLPSSAQRFRERALSKGPDTIDVQRELVPAIYYLLEEYGVRPTQQSSGSSGGSPGGTSGTTSTAGVQVEELTPQS